MYKTLTSQIIKLEKENLKDKEREKIELKIQRYQSEITKIKKKFSR